MDGVRSRPGGMPLPMVALMVRATLMTGQTFQFEDVLTEFFAPDNLENSRIVSEKKGVGELGPIFRFAVSDFSVHVSFHL